jgi:hypothetical protein
LKERTLSGNIDLPCLEKVVKKVVAIVLAFQWQNIGSFLHKYPCYNTIRDTQIKEGGGVFVFSGQQEYWRPWYGKFV